MRFLTVVALLAGLSNAYLVPRASTPQCVGLSAESNNGDRKIAIVVDASYSMLSSDPNDLRLAAGKNLLDWLVTKSEATGGKKQDDVTIIEFSDSAQLDYPLGDPENAYAPLSKINVTGGTYIASGVQMAISQLSASGTGSTADRSGIVVFTDGEDSSTSLLVNQINNAAKAGIRVSFGFLSDSLSMSYQDKDVLVAIMNSGGRYFTINSAQSSTTFVNGILVNGLTKKDNANGDANTLLAGLDSSHYISGSETVTMTYTARNNEKLNFTVMSLDAGNLDIQVKSGSKVLANGKSSYSYTTLDAVAPGDGNIDVKVSAKNAPKNSIFVVGVESNLPVQNCTVGIGKPKSGPNVGAIAGGAVGGIGGLAIVCGLGYFIWKACFHPKTPLGPGSGPGAAAPPVAPKKSWFSFPDHSPPPPAYPAAPPAMPPNQNQSNQPDQHNDKDMDYESGSEYEDVPEEDPNQHPHDPQNPDSDSHLHNKRPRPRMQRVRIYGNNHHHHMDPAHPCYITSCPLTKSDHVCDPHHACTCVDPKCKLNSRLHFCTDSNAPLHRCPGPKRSPNCPLMDPQYAEYKKKEHSELVRLYMMQDFAKSGVKTAATYTIRTLAM